MKNIVYKPAHSSGVSVVALSKRHEEKIEYIAAQIIDTESAVLILDKSQLPENHDFFDAWVIKDKKVGIDSSKAKAIWKNKWRAVRAAKLAELDVEFMRAVETGDAAKQAEISAEKQALRDVTQTPLPDDVEGIKKTWPEILGPQPTE